MACACTDTLNTRLRNQLLEIQSAPGSDPANNPQFGDTLWELRRKLALAASEATSSGLLTEEGDSLITEEGEPIVLE